MTMDEVQLEPGLLGAVKRAVDNDPVRQNGRFVLTGSANLLLMQRVSETLAGRATYVSLWPLSRGERLGGGSPGMWTELLSAPAQDWPNLIESRTSAAGDWRKEARAGSCSTAAVKCSGCQRTFSPSRGDRCCRLLNPVPQRTFRRHEGLPTGPHAIPK